MSLELRDRLRARYGTEPSTPVLSFPCACGGTTHVRGGQCSDCMAALPRAFAFQSEAGRTVITAPLREVALKNDGFQYLHGRFVQADTPNGNGAMWTSEDLELGSQTVAGGPLNWLHDDRKIIGTLLDGRFVSDRETAGIGNHITSTAAVWRFLFPDEAKTIERAAQDGDLYYSMECVSREVACVGDSGCGEKFPYAAYDAKQVCSHLRERSSIRRFVDPVFLGGAVIIPPVKPGWDKAEVDVVRQAAALTEQHGLADNMRRDVAEAMTAQILLWANR